MSASESEGDAPSRPDSEITVERYRVIENSCNPFPTHVLFVKK
jgi:hypothetical protein